MAIFPHFPRIIANTAADISLSGNDWEEVVFLGFVDGVAQYSPVVLGARGVSDCDSLYISGFATVSINELFGFSQLVTDITLGAGTNQLDIFLKPGDDFRIFGALRNELYSEALIESGYAPPLNSKVEVNLHGAVYSDFEVGSGVHLIVHAEENHYDIDNGEAPPTNQTLTLDAWSEFTLSFDGNPNPFYPWEPVFLETNLILNVTSSAKIRLEASVQDITFDGFADPTFNVFGDRGGTSYSELSLEFGHDFTQLTSGYSTPSEVDLLDIKNDGVIFAFHANFTETFAFHNTAQFNYLFINRTDETPAGTMVNVHNEGGMSEIHMDGGYVFNSGAIGDIFGSDDAEIIEIRTDNLNPYFELLSGVVPGSVGIAHLAGGNDEFRGANGTTSYMVDGEAGDDIIIGGAANDRLSAGSGTNTLTGGAGTDTFVFNAATGSTTITDFNEFEILEIRGLMTKDYWGSFTIHDGKPETVYFGFEGRMNASRQQVDIDVISTGNNTVISISPGLTGFSQTHREDINLTIELINFDIEDFELSLLNFITSETPLAFV